MTLGQSQYLMLFQDLFPDFDVFFLFDVMVNNAVCEHKDNYACLFLLCLTTSLITEVSLPFFQSLSYHGYAFNYT